MHVHNPFPGAIVLAALILPASAWATHTNAYEVSGADGSYTIDCLYVTGTLTLYSSGNITVTDKGGPAVQVTQPDPETVTIQCPRIAGQVETLAVTVDPEHLFAVEPGGSVLSRLYVDGALIPVGDLEGGVHYVQRQTTGQYMRILEPQGGAILQKGQAGVIRLLASEDMWGRPTYLYLQRIPSTLDGLETPDGSPINPATLEPEYDWDIMSVNNVCHDWYITIGVYTSTGYKKYQTRPFWVLHDLTGTCPIALAY